MKERKQQVLKNAHQLFVEKGYQATSIQDILDYSGISKGTFYNYFSSKSELLKAIFISLHKNFEKERNELLIGQDPADIEIFIKQMELRMHSHKQNKLFILVEEVFFSNDEELKQFIKRSKFFELRWLYNRFVDIFGEDKKPYLLDCAIMFFGILQHQSLYHSTTNLDFSETELIRYCTDRLTTLVEDVSQRKVQLISPEQFSTWFPDCSNDKQSSKNEILQSIGTLKKEIAKLPNDTERKKYMQLLDFVQEELLLKNAPRYFLIESAILSLKICPALQKTKALDTLKTFIE
ncbi:TetR/AcrR family transcriptional regulator [Peribacillus asahii]|uniref:TetR family transcriptional regulator n=1 Tax=Peribacillus asahii TaxID=228899 RepID=A0A3T0KXE1_9BACI|nr:TetR/AcrR family transcriptional regulator [Peribacillus asahii]AZV45004.1 TetR family transcriptional regulator [Peribacillus asahii]USK84625.1 TetR/AcrR family transcriptional regulator [Peribacillus asahii]